MGAVTVVLLAEGSGEVKSSSIRGMGDTIPADDWGPAHFLFQRVIEASSSIPAAAVRFVEPARTNRGTVAKGSDLHEPRSVRRLLGYPIPVERPTLAILLVDADGKKDRQRVLEDTIADLPGATVVAVAVEEFESWLLADADALKVVLDVDRAQLPARPEDLRPRESKALLSQLSVDAPEAVRESLAKRIDLSVVAAACPSFDRCLDLLKKRLTAAR